MPGGAAGANAGTAVKKGSIWDTTTVNNLWHCGECLTECEVDRDTCSVCGAAKPSGASSSVSASSSRVTTAVAAVSAAAAQVCLSAIHQVHTALMMMSARMQVNIPWLVRVSCNVSKLNQILSTIHRVRTCLMMMSAGMQSSLIAFVEYVQRFCSRLIQNIHAQLDSHSSCSAGALRLCVLIGTVQVGEEPSCVGSLRPPRWEASV